MEQHTSLEPLGTLSSLIDLNLNSCISLPSSALSPLSRCTALKVLDIRVCTTTFDLAPLAAYRDLRRLYTFTPSSLPELDLEPLQGLMPRLEVKRGSLRTEWEDASLL